MERRLKADNLDFSAENLLEAGITQNETFENYDLQKCTDEILNYIHAKANENELNYILISKIRLFLLWESIYG